MMQEERPKPMTQEGLRRSASQHLVATPQDRVDRQKIKRTLGKINALAQGAITADE
jgi:hypothetical protein